MVAPDPPLKSTLQVGARISQGAHRGTIRFVGEVPPTQGTWLGVEWDDAMRGKHDGTHNGKRYFACRNLSAKTPASFIRPNASGLSYGSSFLQALRYKYGGAVEEHSNNDEPASRRYTRRNLADIEVEAPNMDGVRQRMARLDRLRDVGLGGWTMERDPEAKGEAGAAVSRETGEQIQIARALAVDADERTGEIAKTCSNIRWLDLSRSLLPTWSEVAKITSELPVLDTLALHFNRFAAVNVGDWCPNDDAFSALKDLRLDGTLITWPEMCLLSAKMPALESLQLGANQLRSLQHLEGAATDTPFPNLQQLNLAENELSNWPSLLSTLAMHCPRLRRLIVSGNRFMSIPPPPPAEATSSSLQHVSLAGNALSSWTDVDNLNTWTPDLQSLVLSPELCSFGSQRHANDGDARSTRLLIIARMNSSLETLNQARITNAERRDAELFYISTVERETIGMPETQRQALHPRWAALSAKHGSASKTSQGGEKNLAASVSTTTLRSKLLLVRIHASTAPPSSTPPYVVSPLPSGATEVKLLTSTPLRLLQGKIARSLGILGGAKAIQSIWALLSAHMDPLQATAIQLRREMRPSASVAGEDGDIERIVYALDNLDWDLAGYNFSLGDELVVVVADAGR